MPDYQRSAKVKASADALFDYLSDIRNLPKYFSSMTSAKSAGPDEVKVTAESPWQRGGGQSEVPRR